MVKLAKEAKQFEEDTAFFRELEKSLQEPQHDGDGSDTPVFNKRLFASQGSYNAPVLIHFSRMDSPTLQ